MTTVKHLALCPSHNVKKSDATGAFQPEAHAYIALHGGVVRTFDPRPEYPARRVEVEAILAEYTGLESFALFGHGFKTGCQTGHLVGQIYRLARSLKAACVAAPIIALYCCSTGRDDDGDLSDDLGDNVGGDGGFADMLRDELRKQGVRATIFGHTCDGHTTYNPFVRRFLPDEAAGGRWIVTPPQVGVTASPPFSPGLWKRWQRALRETDLRLRFPFMTSGEIGAELGRPTLPPSVA